MQPRSVVEVGEGRVLTYVEYGDPTGAVVVCHHGGLLSATDVAPLHEPAARLGVRLVSFDRPGVAGSSPLPGRTTADGAADARAVLDRLEVHDAYALGWSMGGQYALATAALLGDRVLSTAVVAGCVPLDDDALGELNTMDRRLTAMAVEHRRSLEQVAALWGGLARFSPRMWARAAASGEGRVDLDAVRAHADELAASAHDMAEQPEGIVEEYLAWARPWGFAPADVASPVRVWQGAADHLVPDAWAHRLVDALPQAELRLVPDVGHFLLLTEGEQVLRELVGR